MGDLRKLIKYEERIGVNINANGSVQSIYSQSTYSVRAKQCQETGTPQKLDTNLCCYCVENKCKIQQLPEKVSNQCVEKPIKCCCKDEKEKEPKPSNQIRFTINLVEDIVSEILKHTFEDTSSSCPSKESVPSKKGTKKNLKCLFQTDSCKTSTTSFISSATSENKKVDINKLRPFVLDIVLKFLADKFSLKQNGECDYSLPKDVQWAVECIIMKKLKEYFCDKKESMTNLTKDVQGKASHSKIGKLPTVKKASKNKFVAENIMDELLARKSPSQNTGFNATSYRKPEWQQTKNDKGEPVVIKRLPYTLAKTSNWQEMDVANKVSPKPNKNQQRHRSPQKNPGALVPTMGKHNRKPFNTDPVKLYQYYSQQWEHFANQIPQYAKRDSQCWRIRERFLNVKK